MMKWLLAFAGLLAGFGLGAWLSTERPAAALSTGGRTAEGSARPVHTIVGKPDPVGEILAALRKKPNLKEFAALAGPLSCLTAQQMGELIERLEREAEDSSDYRPGRLATWWLGRDPQAVSKWTAQRLQKLAENPPLQASSIDSTQMIQAWAGAFPEEAIALAKRYPKSAVAAAILFQKRLEKWNAPPAEAWPLLRDFPESRSRAREAGLLFERWAGKDAAAAFAAALSLAPGGTRDTALATTLPGLAAKDAAFAFEQYNRLGLADPDLVAKMVAGAASRDPAGTAAWLLQLDPMQIQKAIPGLVAKWAAQDPAAAFDWMRAHPSEGGFEDPMTLSFIHTGFGREMIPKMPSERSARYNAPAEAMQNKPAEAIAWVRTLPAGEERERMTQSFLAHAKAEDALLLFGDLSPDGQAKAASSILGKLEPKRASAWAGELPVGQVRESAWGVLGMSSADDTTAPLASADRDAWLAGSMRRGNPYQPVAIGSFDIMLKIENPTKRREVFDQVMESYSGESSAWNIQAEQKEARKWMEKAKLPDEWKVNWRK